MKEVLEALLLKASINIPLSTIPELHSYIKTLPELYSFRYEYPDEESVNVTLTEINVRSNSKIQSTCL